MGEKGAELIVRWLGDVSGLEAASAKAEHATEKTSSKFSMLKTAAAGAAVGGALVLAEGLNKSVEAAEKDQVATARLEGAFRSVHQALGPYKGRIDAAEASARKLGFTGEQVKDSLGSLEIATHNGGKAIGELSAAEDIARFKHIDLAAATKMLVMAQTGSQRATKQLGIEVQATTRNQDLARIANKKADDALKAQFPTFSKMTQAQRDQYDALKNNLDLKYSEDKIDAKLKDHQITGAAVTEMVTQKLHGQAAAYAETAAGAKERFGAALDELEVKVGSKLLPVLTKLEIWLADNLPQAIDKLSRFWDQHGDQIIAVAQKIGAVVIPQLRAIGDVIRLVADLLQGHWSKAWDDMKRLVIDNIDAVKARVMLEVTIIETIFGGLAAKVESGLSALGKVVTGAFNTSLAFVKALPRRFYDEALSIGKDLVRGILDGITGLGNSLYNKATSEMGAGLHKIKSWARIGSPSGLFRDEVGRPFAQGITEGFIDGMTGFAQTVVGIINLGIQAGTGALDTGFQTMYDAVSTFASNLLNQVNAAVAAAAYQWGVQVGATLPGSGNWQGFNIPQLASGGIVTSPTVLLAGEAGPEAIVPLNAAGGFGGSVNVYVTVQGAVIGSDLKSATNDIRRELLRTQKRIGKPILG